MRRGNIHVYVNYYNNTAPLEKRDALNEQESGILNIPPT